MSDKSKKINEEIDAVVPMKGDKDTTTKKKGEGDDKTDKDAAKIDAVDKMPKSGNNSPVLKKGEMDENLELMFTGSELTEDFKKKASVIFETALAARVKVEVAKIEEEAAEAIQVKLAESEVQTLAQIDAYMENIVAEWAEENKLAIEAGVRNEIAEAFITDLKSLFEKHNISIPAEKVDMLEAADAENADLRKSVATLSEQLAAKEATIFDMNKTDVLRGLSEGLANTQVEKLNNLVKEIDCKTIEAFKEKATIIRESFTSGTKSAKDEPEKKKLNETDELMDKVYASMRKND